MVTKRYHFNVDFGCLHEFTPSPFFFKWYRLGVAGEEGVREGGRGSERERKGERREERERERERERES